MSIQANINQITSIAALLASQSGAAKQRITAAEKEKNKKIADERADQAITERFEKGEFNPAAPAEVKKSSELANQYKAAVEANARRSANIARQRALFEGIEEEAPEINFNQRFAKADAALAEAQNILRETRRRSNG